MTQGNCLIGIDRACIIAILSNFPTTIMGEIQVYGLRLLESQ